MPEVPPARNYALEILTLARKADVDSLAVLAQGLATSLAAAEATIAEMRRADDERKRQARERTSRARSRNVTQRHATERDPPSLSPTPPFPTPTSTSSSPPAREASWQPDRETKLAAFLETDADRNALTAVLAKADNKTAVIAELWMILDGERSGVSRDKRHVGLALCDYAANEARWSSVLFRSYVQRAAKPPAEPLKRRGGTGQRTYDNALRAIPDAPEAG